LGKRFLIRVVIKLVGIWNNLAMWAGAADSAELRSKVLYYYARAVEREKK
jgi:hypothetical protein